MQGWEYKIAKLTQGAIALERELNQLGADGWELIDIKIDPTSSLTRGQGEGLLGTFKRPSLSGTRKTPQDLVGKQSAGATATPTPEQGAPAVPPEHHDHNRLDELSEDDAKAIEALFKVDEDSEDDLPEPTPTHEPAPQISDEDKAAVRAMMNDDEDTGKETIRARMEGRGR